MTGFSALSELPRALATPILAGLMALTQARKCLEQFERDAFKLWRADQWLMCPSVFTTGQRCRNKHFELGCVADANMLGRWKTLWGLGSLQRVLGEEQVLL